MTPEWMNPESPSYMRNWENTPMLPETVLVRLTDGSTHPTMNGIHLARFLSVGGSIVEPEVEAPAGTMPPESVEEAKETPAEEAAEAPTVEEA